MKTSSVLKVGEIYSRNGLAKTYDIQDATLRTGIFQPAGHDSLWLFITEEPTPDRTQYRNLLDGETLLWQGQKKGRKDVLITDHKSLGLELLVFYRKRKDEFPEAGFRYVGVFDYVSHERGLPEDGVPSSFVLKSSAEADLLKTVKEDLRTMTEEESRYEGRFSKRLVNYYERDPKLRAEAIQIHGVTCRACGFDFEAVYGEHGKDYIEVHHLTMVSRLERETLIDPRRDMTVVCSNCHRMIHRRTSSPLNMEDLGKLLEGRSLK